MLWCSSALLCWCGWTHDVMCSGVAVFCCVDAVEPMTSCALVQWCSVVLVRLLWCSGVLCCYSGGVEIKKLLCSAVMILYFAGTFQPSVVIPRDPPMSVPAWLHLVLCVHIQGADPESSAGGRIMASAGAQAYMGVWGLAPSGVQGRSPWSGG